MLLLLIWRIPMYENELYHHGILGQKWGKKNGPPYPLSSSDHSSAEKKAGWRKSLSDRRAESARKRAAKAEIKRRAEQSKRDKKAAEDKAREEAARREEQSRRDKKEAEKAAKREKERQAILKDPSKLNKHRDEFSNDEIKKALERYDLEMKLRDANLNKLSTAKKYIDTVLGYYQTISKAYGTYTAIRTNVKNNADIDKTLGEIAASVASSKKNKSGKKNQNSSNKSTKNDSGKKSENKSKQDVVDTRQPASKESWGYKERKPVVVDAEWREVNPPTSNSTELAIYRKRRR